MFAVREATGSDGERLVPGQHPDAPERHVRLDPRRHREAQPDPQPDRGQPQQRGRSTSTGSAGTSGTGTSRSARPAGRRRSATTTSRPASSRTTTRSSASSRSRRAPTRSSPSGREAASSASTAPACPQLLGQAVSHGCVRVSNTTARALEDARAARHADLDQEVAERNWKAGRPSAARKPAEPRAR